jgi:hypothetical protein
MTSKRKNKGAARAAKRQRFSSPDQKTPQGASPLVLIGGLLVVMVIIAGTLWALRRPSQAAPVSAAAAPPVSAAAEPARAATSGHAPYPEAVADNGVVQLAAATFDDYQAHYYTYMHDGEPIEFFVLKSNDGVVRAAFNACDVCFESHRGYSQSGDEMVCNNCGRRFPADKINVLQGGCNPSPLKRTLEGDTLVIRVEDIISGASYF